MRPSQSFWMQFVWSYVHLYLLFLSFRILLLTCDRKLNAWGHRLMMNATRWRVWRASFRTTERKISTASCHHRKRTQRFRCWKIVCHWTKANCKLCQIKSTSKFIVRDIWLSGKWLTSKSRVLVLKSCWKTWILTSRFVVHPWVLTLVKKVKAVHHCPGHMIPSLMLLIVYN